jgi:hypothetical protein
MDDMRKKKWVAALLVLAAAGSTAGCRCSRDGQPGRPESLTEQSFALSNGLQADLVTGPCGDSAALVVLLAAGVDHDPPGRSGLARVAGRVLATAPAIGRAERTVETGSDFTLYSVAVPADRLLGELDEVASWMARPAATEAALERGRAQVLAEVAKRQGADPALTAVSLAEQALRPAPGDGRRDGIASEVQAITLAELQEFWQAHFKPVNARIVVAGRFDAGKVRSRIESAFGPLPAGTPPVPRAPAAGSVRGTLVMGSAPSAVAVAVPAPAPSDPLFAPFLLLAGRLLEKPSQPRAWEARYDPLGRPDLLSLTGPVGQAESPEPAAERIRSEAAAILARALAPDDVARTRETFRLFLEPRSLDPGLCAKDPRALARARARHAQLHLGDSSARDALARITPEQLEEAARLFDARHSTAVIAGGDLR